MAAASAVAPAAAMGGARLPAAGSAASCSLLIPPLPRRASSLLLASPSRLRDAQRFSSVKVKATSSSEESSSSIQSEELLADLKEKWDAVENKSTVLLYGGGALVAIWLSSVVVGAINSVPLLPKLMELVGLGYTGWFVYRYLLFKESRKELAEDIEALKKKIAGSGE
ncbi:protein CURVATURE THYLAKOID 1A, chloroplastic-like [Ananas comosus]|uniref:Protein CURVATURE THYLAKOID 1A, chloroplastic-like n=1 Tax=Ananas comosus TaxID=4615 RepID=A0A6P5H3Q6_ANACO|nr:protein CURVATURE THYLAKOID 1A, chloroplastic-like [Ananas comosus]